MAIVALGAPAIDLDCSHPVVPALHRRIAETARDMEAFTSPDLLMLRSPAEMATLLDRCPTGDVDQTEVRSGVRSRLAAGSIGGARWGGRPVTPRTVPGPGDD